MSDEISKLVDTLNNTTQSIKNGNDINEIIGIIRAELYSYFANMNNLLTKFIEKNESIIYDNNAKLDIFRKDINRYIENNNNLLREVANHLKEISEKVSKPVLIPPPLEIPKEMLNKMDRMIELLEKTHGELEGLDFRTGQKTISKSNTPERMAHKFRSKSMLVVAEKTNSDIIYLGSEGVGPKTGTKLNAGESIQLDSNQATREIWIYGTKGDGVNFVALSYKPETIRGGSR